MSSRRCSEPPGSCDLAPEPVLLTEGVLKGALRLPDASAVRLGSRAQHLELCLRRRLRPGRVGYRPLGARNGAPLRVNSPPVRELQLAITPRSRKRRYGAKEARKAIGG